MKLKFSKQEQLSIQYLVQCLIKADGLVLPEENVCWNTISLKMKWEESAPEVLETVDFHDAIEILVPMDEDKKRFVKAFFFMIILADQHIAPEEMGLLQEISREAQLPEIPVADCASVLEQYIQ